MIFAPSESVFVSAHAGSGKTRQLAERVLKLLLYGVHPARILCLTFTRAAAAEMAVRIQEELGRWVMMAEAELAGTLTTLLGHAPPEAMLPHARSLFATVLEEPEGVRIQTIHSFCQSLLGRFPVEAGISPHFTLMEERTAQEMLHEARLRVLNTASLDGAIGVLARTLNAEQFHELLGSVVKQKRAFQSLLRRPGGAEAAIDELWQRLAIARDATPESLIEEHFAYDDITRESLRRIAGILLAGKETDVNTGQGILDWFSAAQGNRGAVEAYARVFLTDRGEKRKRLFTKDTLADAAQIERLLQEQERVARFHDARQSLAIGQLTAAMLHVAASLLAVYESLKTAHARMDYDDLILTARDLLRRPGISPWVLFKLDGGIDHVLVDEAQDTSPEQWDIIDALTGDFFAGQSKSETDRSLFIVGDEKQSIFSFQGADVCEFARWREHFRRRIAQAQKPLDLRELTESHRSAPDILKAVDAVFAAPEVRAGVTSGDRPLAHASRRKGEPGLVELWPLVGEDESQWLSPRAQLAHTIADTIRRWLDEGMWLDAKQRAVTPGDIMILLRSRTTFADSLVRALKRKQVPVAGIDRMKLKENLAVQDLLALGKIMLLPADDLTLAALLKSPICNIGEEELFALCWQRGDKDLWQRLQGRVQESEQYAAAYGLLDALRGKADFMPPYEFYAHALDTLGLRRRFLGRMGEEAADPIDEFLLQALAYQRDNAPSLQGFLHWLESSDSDIKRDMEQAKDCVRVMTVHGAKGLQAPVVILPDTMHVPQMKDNLFWTGDSVGLPVWSPTAECDNHLVRSLRERAKQEQLEEYRRLLYVAMTRAEDHLYICGAVTKKAQEQSWYHCIEQALQPLAAACDTPLGPGLRLGSAGRPAGGTVKERAARQSVRAGREFDFLHRPAPQENVPTKPLLPSRMADDTPSSSPREHAIYARGRLIHLLLQHLPAIPKTQRLAVAGALAAPYARHLQPQEREQCIHEAIALIGQPQFAELFSPAALAEAPIAGVVQFHGGPVTVSGQIDRLHVGEKEIWVVDYKTNRNPPSHRKDTPVAYVRQMALYRKLLQGIYPQKTIRAALLWTAVPRMDVLDERQLEALDKR